MTNLQHLCRERETLKRQNGGFCLQLQIIRNNKGWFGAKAKARKAAREQLTKLQQQMEDEFLNGRP